MLHDCNLTTLKPQPVMFLVMPIVGKCIGPKR